MVDAGSLLQYLLTGISQGTIYALVGLGLTLVYTTTRVINMALGDFAAYGALTAATVVAAGGTTVVAGLAGVAVGLGLGVATYLIVVRPAQRRGSTVLTLLIATIAAHLTFVGIALAIWGTGPHTLPPFTAGPAIKVFSASVSRQSIWILVVAAALFFALWVFFARTMAGKALRACAVNPLGARLSGVRVARLGLLAFAVSSALAGATGVLLIPQTFATFDMGLRLTLMGFVGAAVGKLESYPLTVAGCLFLGLLESFAAGIFSAGYRDAVVFAFLIAVLLWRALPTLRHGVLVTEEAAAE
jgi:branched-chain amino acid transport system permease protein